MLGKLFVKGTVSMIQIRKKYIISNTLFNTKILVMGFTVLVTRNYSFDLTVEIQLGKSRILIIHFKKK